MALEDAKREIDRSFTGDLKGLAYENAFAGATSFLRRRYTKDLTGVDLVVTGVPFDQAVTHRSGTRMGPRAIREASTLQPYDPPYGWGGFDPLSEFAIVDYGDLAFDYAYTPSFPGLLQQHIAGILAQGPGTVSLGGDHFMTLPILRAYAEKYGPMSVIQFDAHSDLWADDDMDRIDHGTFMYKAVKAGIVDVTRSVQVGIRTECDDYCGMPYIDARTCHEKGAMIRPYNIQTGAAPFDALQCADLGDVAINTFSLSASIRLITEAYDAHLKHDVIPMGLGGDHTLTLPILRAIAKKHGPVALVHVDAHADVNDEMFGERETHGTVF